jgi:hypothetical protein
VAHVEGARALGTSTAPRREEPDLKTWDSWVVYPFPGGTGKDASRTTTKLT